MANYHVEGGLQLTSLPVTAEQRSLFDILRPIIDASHVRDRKRSPPDSSFFRGTRAGVIMNVNGWARSPISTASEPHVRWMHGYVGSGKSSISQEVCDTSVEDGRPVISFFFFRNAGDRSRIWRLPTTLASQMAVAIPETEPIIRAAVRANPALLTPDEGGVSIQARMQQLVYAPFKAAIEGETTRRVGIWARMKRVVSAPFKTATKRETRVRGLARGPFLIVLDGLDECEDKDEIQELINGMLLFFNKTPLIPLRVFITSRVEEHIQSHLNVSAVKLDNLVDHCSNDDIDTFLRLLFEDACRRNPVIQAYVQEHGEWPTQNDRRKLVEHVGGSFIFASAIFKFIMDTKTEGDGAATPMDRLPLTLKMNPDLDELYTQVLARSRDLPHFTKIISTIALLRTPLSTLGIAEILGIHKYEVVNVLVNLQSIIQLPGTDDMPVTVCHTSLRDFLTTQCRSHEFFAHPSLHFHLHLRCLECKLKYLRQDAELFIRPRSELPPVAQYALQYFYRHLFLGMHYSKQADFNSAIDLCRQGLALRPGTPELIAALAKVLRCCRQVAGLAEHEDEAITLSRAALGLRPHPHPDRSDLLLTLGGALLLRHERTGIMVDLEEAISLDREALRLRPPPHPLRSLALHNLGNAILDRHRATGDMEDLQETISLLREALELRQPPHPDRQYSLCSLAISLIIMYKATHILSDLQDAIAFQSELLEAHHTVGHYHRPDTLRELANLLQMRFDAMNNEEDRSRIATLRGQATQLSASSTGSRR